LQLDGEGVGNITTDPILVKPGLRQENAISSILFNILVEKVIRKKNIKRKKELNFRSLS